MSKVKQPEYPQNLLNVIAKQLHKINNTHPQTWDYNLPSDFDASLAYLLATLPKQESQFILMHFRDGLSYSDIARKCGCSREWSRQVINKAICHLGTTSSTRFLQYGVNGIISIEREMWIKNALTDRIKDAIRTIHIISEEMENITKAKSFKNNVRTFNLTNNAKIEELELSARSYNALRRHNIQYVEELTALSLEELQAIQNLGVKSVNEIIQKMRRYNLYFVEEKPPLVYQSESA